MVGMRGGRGPAARFVSGLVGGCPVHGGSPRRPLGACPSLSEMNGSEWEIAGIAVSEEQ